MGSAAISVRETRSTRGIEQISDLHIRVLLADLISESTFLCGIIKKVQDFLLCAGNNSEINPATSFYRIAVLPWYCMPAGTFTLH